eukprot:1152079-Pelagomonas_calceolata.AAC.12
MRPSLHCIYKWMLFRGWTRSVLPFAWLPSDARSAVQAPLLAHTSSEKGTSVFPCKEAACFACNPAVNAFHDCREDHVLMERVESSAQIKGAQSRRAHRVKGCTEQEGTQSKRAHSESSSVAKPLPQSTRFRCRTSAPQQAVMAQSKQAHKGGFYCLVYSAARAQDAQSTPHNKPPHANQAGPQQRHRSCRTCT